MMTAFYIIRYEFRFNYILQFSWTAGEKTRRKEETDATWKSVILLRVSELQRNSACNLETKTVERVPCTQSWRHFWDSGTQCRFCLSSGTDAATKVQHFTSKTCVDWRVLLKLNEGFLAVYLCLHCACVLCYLLRGHCPRDGIRLPQSSAT